MVEQQLYVNFMFFSGYISGMFTFAMISSGFFHYSHDVFGKTTTPERS